MIYFLNVAWRSFFLYLSYFTPIRYQAIRPRCVIGVGMCFHFAFCSYSGCSLFAINFLNFLQIFFILSWKKFNNIGIKNCDDLFCCWWMFNLFSCLQIIVNTVWVCTPPASRLDEYACCIISWIFIFNSD